MLRQSAHLQRCLAGDEQGATAVEYGIMMAFIAAVIIGVVTTLGLDLVPGFTTVEGGLPAGPAAN